MANTAYSAATVNIPKSAGYKAGTLFGWNATNDSTVPFTVTRALDTATRVNSAGLIETVLADTPRLDYTYGGCGDFLIEPTRENLVSDSNFFNPINASQANKDQVGPDGVANSATNLIFGVGSEDWLTSTFDTVAGTTYQYTIYHKITNQVSVDPKLYIRIVYPSTAQSLSPHFSSTTEWQRYTFEFTALETGTTSTNNRLVGVDGAFGDEIAVFGYMVEVGSYPTSYIPTTTAPVTRNADVIQLEPASAIGLLGDQEGTMMIESRVLDADSTSKSLSLSDNSLNASYRLRYTSSNTIEYNLIDGGSTQFSLTDITTDITEFSKNLFTYKDLDYKLFVDGSLKGTNTSISNVGLNSLTTFQLNRGGSGEPFYGRIRSLLIYNQSLTTDESTLLSAYVDFVDIANSKNYEIV